MSAPGRASDRRASASRTTIPSATFLDRAWAYAVAPGVVFKGSWAIDHQAVNRLVREDPEHGDGVFWTLSDGTVVPVARAQQATLGATYEMPGLLFDAHAYYRRLDSLSMFAPRLLPGTALTAPNTAFYTGTGDAVGVEVFVQHRLERNTPGEHGRARAIQLSDVRRSSTPVRSDAPDKLTDAGALPDR